jgi:DNA-binding MarR family transcriptional regulator
MTTPHQPATKAPFGNNFVTATKPRAAKALADSIADLPAHPAHVAPLTTGAQDGWRVSHLGRLLGESVRRFDTRVLTLMAHDIDVPLALSNLAARGQVSAAHIHITRHVALGGSRLTDLAAAAGMSKQAMGDLVTQCEAWGIVQRLPDPADARARLVCFTQAGLQWLAAFEAAVAQAEAEFRQEVGDDVAQVVAFGLEGYSRSYA